MKNKKKIIYAFSLPELLIVLVIIGILAALTLNVLGTKVDRNKALFKKAYNNIERTVVELINDETYYPTEIEDTGDYYGLNNPTDKPIVGSNCYTRCTANCSAGTGTASGLCLDSSVGPVCGNSSKPCTHVGRLVKFCNLFSNNLSRVKEPIYESVYKYGIPKELKNGEMPDESERYNYVQDMKTCKFSTVDGIDWTITAQRNSEQVYEGSLDEETDPSGNTSIKINKSGTDPVHGFLITVDVNGEENGVNLPSNVADKVKEHIEAPGRDRFFVYVRYDGKIIIDPDDTVAHSYVKSTNINREL